MTSKYIENKLNAFVTWFTEQGGYIHPATELSYDINRGVHLRIRPDAKLLDSTQNPTATLPRGTLVISCPHSASLSALNVYGLPPIFPSHLTNLTEEDEKFFAQLRKEARPQFVAAIWLCAQWLEREQGWWHRYFDIIPKTPLGEHRKAGEDEDRGLGDFDSPLWWTVKELRWIKGTNLERGWEDLEEAWNEEWKHWEELIVMWAERRGWKMSWGLFLWAMTVLGSRAFSSSQIASVPTALSTYNPDMLLYPGVDSLNHNPLTQNRWVSDEERFGIVCEDVLKPGDEVWNPYGGKSNGELLLSYGFALPANPCDTFALRLPQPPHLIIALVDSAQRPSPESSSEPPPAIHTNPTPPGPSPMTPHNTPPALALEHNTYYIRASARFSVQEPHYPPITTSKSGTDHLVGFPTLLLSSLSCTLASPAELTSLQAHPVSYTTSSIYRELGPRNLAATSSLLLARLQMELARLDALTKSNKPTNPKDPRSRHRKDLVKIHLTSQSAILRDNIALITRYFCRLFTHTTRINVKAPKTLTLSIALSALRAYNRDIYDAFTTSIDAAFGTIDSAALRLSDREWDVWTLLVGTLLFSTSSSAVSSSARTRETWLGPWISTLCTRYNFPSHRTTGITTTTTAATENLANPAPNEGNSTPNEGNPAPNEETAQMVAYISERITVLYTHAYHSLLPTSPALPVAEELWTHDLWTPTFIRACVDTVRGESAVIKADGEIKRSLRQYESVVDVDEHDPGCPCGCDDLWGQEDEEEEEGAEGAEDVDVVVMFPSALIGSGTEGGEETGEEEV